MDRTQCSSKGGAAFRGICLDYLRAIVTGLAIGLVAANVWPLLLLKFGVPVAAAVETGFRRRPAACVGETPRRMVSCWSSDPARVAVGLAAAISFAITVHAAIVVLFRLVPYPAAAFHTGYDFSFIPTAPMRWLAVVVSAMSAGICEETGFRGYMQRPNREAIRP